MTGKFQRSPDATHAVLLRLTVVCCTYTIFNNHDLRDSISQLRLSQRRKEAEVEFGEKYNYPAAAGFQHNNDTK